MARSRFGQDLPRFEPASLGDPVALTTEWTPCVRGGSSFCTHKLVQRSPTTVGFRPTIGACLFYLVFFAVGVFLLAKGLPSALAQKSAGAGIIVLILIMVLMFGGGGAYMLWQGTRPIVFDRSLRMFWKGWSRPFPDSAAFRNDVIPFDQIHALQIISERCSGKNKSFYSYELNVVKKDGSRVNVVDHGDRAQLTGDAMALSQFLEVPLWDPA
jgi:hypothetical protein